MFVPDIAASGITSGGCLSDCLCLFRGDVIKKFHILYAVAVLHIVVVALASEEHIGTDWNVGRNGEPVLFYLGRRIDL